MTDADAELHSELDELDRRMIGLLREDGRMSNRELAQALGVHERTARTRLRRLLDSDLMRVVAVADAGAGGLGLMATVGIRVADRSPAEVAADLAELPQVNTVHLMSGEHDIEVLVVAEDLDEMRAVLRVPGIRRATPALMLDVYKHETDWVPFT